MSLNRCTISGNLGADPELRLTQGGSHILSMRIAVNDRRKNSQTGEYEDYCNWVSATMFGPRAEAISKHLRKGQKVAIDGKLRYSEWERDGYRRSKLEVIVDDLEFMSRNEGQQQGGYGGNVSPQVAYAAQQAQAATGYDDWIDESIPF